MKKAKHLINGIVWILVGLYVLLMVLLHVPAFQSFLGKQASNVLRQKFGTEVSLGRINLGFLNRIIIDDVMMEDQTGIKMLHASRLSAKIDLIPLLEKKISVSSVQFFGLQGTFYQRSEAENPNFQFLLDSLASKDTTRHTPIDLRIGSIVIRHSGFTFDRHDLPRTNGRFNMAHLNVSDLSAHILLPRFTDKNIDVSIKKLSMKEGSGLQLDKLALHFTANPQNAILRDFQVELPHSRMAIDSVGASYTLAGNRVEMATLKYGGAIEVSKITPSDLACFEPQMASFKNPITFSSTFSGTSNMLQVLDLQVNSKEGELNVSASGSVSSNKKWFARVKQLQMSSHTIEFIERNLEGRNIKMPKEITRLGSIRFQGEAGGAGKNVAVKGRLNTEAGDANIGIGLQANRFSGRLETEGINLRQILDDPSFGILASHINIDGNLALTDLKAKGSVSRLDYNHYSYRNMDIDGTLQGSTASGTFTIDDPNAKLSLDGTVDFSKQNPRANIVGHIQDLAPQAMKLTDLWGDARIGMEITADLAGRSLSTLVGNARVENLTMRHKDGDYHLDQLSIQASQMPEGHTLNLNSDFAQAHVVEHDNFRQAQIDATVFKSDWLNHFFGIPVEINKPVRLTGSRNAKTDHLEVEAQLPEFAVKGIKMDYTLQAQQDNGQLHTILTWDDGRPKPFSGTLDCTTEIFRTSHGKQAFHTRVHESDILVNDTMWHIRPSDILYSDRHLTVDYFSIDHHDQHLTIYGLATPSAHDSLTIDMQDIDVGYIMNLVNFHSVEFTGIASGTAAVKSVFGSIEGNARLKVENFRFEDGRMGTLTAHAHYDMEQKNIDIDAHADDTDGRTIIQGYISPAKNYMSLDIETQNTRLEFIESFCGSFMRNTDLRGRGHVLVAGHLSGPDGINLSGMVVADGSVEISPLNTKYWLRSDTIRMVPNEIIFANNAIYDRDGHTGIINGALHHKNLTRLTFDLNVETRKMLVYDFHDYGDNTFYGTVYGSGACAIRGRSGRIDFDINATPEKGSFIEYNAASPDAISNQEFIEWRDVTKPADSLAIVPGPQPEPSDRHRDIPTDIHLNFQFHTSPENFTLRLLMDQQSGDYISLNGSGILQATYYNKGAFDMFGTYLIDHGTYKLTIQNAIKKDFQFQTGSSIIFGGDPYLAALNLKAQYTVTGVSLSDLQIGNSFKNNNVRVDCMMNISGTPQAPHVDFDLDLPTLGADAKQMVRSLINSEEEMNQQVIYLLAIGRFYAQGENNAGQEQQSQTSLAMQSLLSGTVSQQINNVLSSLTNNSNWNFGANISTGDEGWNNAEYEGILSGRLLNNRLLINGQFGYRDNAATANSSFIGDFDVRYLLTPSGNAAIRVYNQTNDRYFTRNSLNTQGLGIILKRDFSTLRGLFRRERKRLK